MSPSTLTALADETTVPTSFIRDEEERPKVAYNKFSDEISFISLKGIDESGTRVDHGVDAELISQMTKFAKEFFALPSEEKGEVVQDWREIVTYFSYPIRARDYSRWPNKPQGWIAITEKYSEKLMELACKLLEILSEAMGLEKEALTKACVDMDQKVVVNFYPKCPQPDLTLGLKRHTDPGTITLLLQDQVGGLQATKDNGKTWITVQPVEGAFVVNLGDHGQNPAPEAIVHPLKIREGEKAVMDEPITFAEMYRRKMSKDLELARLKKLAKEQQIEAAEKAKLESKSIEEILA
ncbi:Flavanone 3-dioxygenase [Capsicum annuum]|uniref:Flavanone 3-dioxygenase n=1 Tax=Capsicum annuum TaxID=4072 RepID=A0A2G3AA31_CAPAN|nr:Flavanone 3-dioxygenase [Capsicum annuum]PHT91112.1 Flavanone 3-dioxygenase [Capsicum annuum]